MLKKLSILMIVLCSARIHAALMKGDPVLDLLYIHKDIPINDLFYKTYNTVRKHPEKINDINENGYTLLQQALINQERIEHRAFGTIDINKAATEKDLVNTSIETIKILLNNGADPNIPFPASNSKKESRQHFLIKATQSHGFNFPLHIIELLFKYGLDAQAKDSNNNTSLMRLISLLHVWKKQPEYRRKFIQIVIDHTSDLNTQNNKGNTALHLASHFDDLKTARLLTQYLARPDIKNAQGKTPRQTAQLSSGPFPPDSPNTPWYWYFSFASTHYKIVKLLQKAEERLQLSKDARLSQPSPPASSCEKSFN